MFYHKGTQTLETNRLILRQYKTFDAEDMYSNWVTDREAIRFWGWDPHKNIEETRTMLQGWINDYSKTDYYHWVIESKETSEAIGYIYLSEFYETEACAAIHYLLSRKYWNRGIMTEACARVLTFAFDELNLKRIRTRHHEENPASGRVLEKCGFSFVYKEFREFEDSPQLNGVYRIYEVNASAGG